MIISFANEKGGVGKTTICVNLAAYLAFKQRRVLLIDADRQASAVRWHNLGENQAFDVLDMPRPRIHREIERFRKPYSHILIDCPPGSGEVTRSALAASHLAVIPVSPSILDVWSCQDMIHEVKEARRVNKKLRARLVISKKVVGTTLARDVREALEGYRVAVFKSEISHRIAYPKAFVAGLSVLNYEPSGLAAEEIRNLGKELLGG